MKRFWFVMKTALFLLALCSMPLSADPEARIRQALLGSGKTALQEKTYEHKGRQFTYSLAEVTLLGTLKRGAESFHVATAVYERSAPAGGELPPARSHGFILLLTPEYRIACCNRIDLPWELELEGTTLYRNSEMDGKTTREAVGDFSQSDEGTRKHGFLLDGGTFLGYPFKADA